MPWSHNNISFNCSAQLLITHQLINLLLQDFPSLSLTLMSCCWHTNPLVAPAPISFSELRPLFSFLFLLLLQPPLCPQNTPPLECITPIHLLCQHYWFYWCGCYNVTNGQRLKSISLLKIAKKKDKWWGCVNNRTMEGEESLWFIA